MITAVLIRLNDSYLKDIEYLIVDNINDLVGKTIF